MAKETPAQQRTIARVMDEFRHGDLESGPGGKAGKVKNPKQAIAIALSEAGVSNQKTPAQNAKARRTTQAREKAAGRTKADLYAEAKRRDIPGRSSMSKADLERALGAS